MFLSQSQLVFEFNKGNTDVVAKQLRMYGNISKDESWVMTFGMNPGHHRNTTIQHHGFRWLVKMHNGNVVSLVQCQ